MDSDYPAYGEDTFGLEFAAVQWLNLVTNAEEIFNKLLHSILLSGEEKEHIQRWLCLKQECEDCVGSDEATSFDGRQRHSLERIEELTEDTENTQDIGEANEKSSDSQYESDSESDFDYQHPEFDDKLDKYMQCFTDKVDLLISKKLNKDENVASIGIEDTENIEHLKRPASFSYFLSPNLCQRGRRKSIHPGCLSVPIALNQLSRNAAISNESMENKSEEKRSDCKNEFLSLENSYSTETMESNKELKGLNLKLEGKKSELKQIIIDLDNLYQRLAKVKLTIENNERLIKERMRSRSTRESAKVKFRKKYSKLEEEYYKKRSQIARAENLLHEKKRSNDVEFVLRQKTEIEELKNSARNYEKRLKDIGMLQEIVGETSKSVLESETSIMKWKKEFDRIKEVIEKKENSKERLEEEIREDEEKVKVLEEDMPLARCETAPEPKSESSNQLPIVDIHNSITSTENVNELKKEIMDLRNVKDCLIDQRVKLRNKHKKNGTSSTVEKRRILEWEEGIEAIDAVIEYKNEMMCGRTSMDSLYTTAQETQGEQMLVNLLLHLSPDELRTLMLKYFVKVIDLKKNNKKMEEQIYDYERKLLKRAWQIQNLSESLQMHFIEAECQKVALERSHQQELNLMMRHFADESGSSGTEARGQLALCKDDEMSKLRRENKQLRRRLQEMEDIMQAPTLRKGVMRLRSRSTSPEVRPLKQLLPPAPSPTPASSQSAACTRSTPRVTREKNKIIIRLNVPNKKT